MRSLLGGFAVVLVAIGLLWTPGAAQTRRARGLLRSERAVPNRYIVVMADDATPWWRRAAVAQQVAGLHAVRPDRIYERTVSGFSFEGSEQQAAQLATDPAVAYVEEDALVTSDAAQNIPPWGLDRIDEPPPNYDGLYHYNKVLKLVSIYTIDGGIYPDHVDFAWNNISRGTVGGDFMGGNGLDCEGHGTHVASIIAGEYAGVAKSAVLQALRVLGCDGTGLVSNIIAAIDYVTRVSAGHPTVVNMSLGGSPSQAEDDAVRRAVAAGIVMVVAAGNENVDASTKSPARVAEAITVGSSTSFETRASSSNYGAVVDLFAPGQSIWGASHSDPTGFVIKSGTSMAAPHVTGAAALYLSGHPTATPAQVRDWLVSHAAIDMLTGIPAGTPNRLLQVGDLNDAVATGLSVPARMYPGRRYVATLTFENTGLSPWSSLTTLARRYFIGSRNPANNTIWGLNRIPLPLVPTCCAIGFFQVPTDREVPVSFEVIAPQTPGVYNFDWQMIQEPGEWFGESVGTTVQVGSLSEDAAFETMMVPPKMRPGQLYHVSVSFRNTGATWTGGAYVLKPVAQVWGVNQVTKSLLGDVPFGGTIVFNFDVQAWFQYRPQPFQWRLMKGDTQVGDATPRVDIEIGDWQDDAELIAARVPVRMRPGQTYNVSVSYRNRGFSTWTNDQPIWLAILQTQHFNTSNHSLPVSAVPPGGVVTFSFPVTAGTGLGFDHLQWQMFNAGDAGFGQSELFGDVTPDFPVLIANWDVDAAFVSATVPTALAAGSTQQAMVTFKNTGTRTWTSDWPFWLATMENAEPFWSFYESLPVTQVAPNQTVTIPVTLRAPPTPGAYFISWQMVDAGPSPVEPSNYFGEMTPAFSITVTASGRDLSTWSVTDPPGLVSPGAKFTATDWVRNGGSSDAAASTSRFYLSADGVKDAGDTLLTGTRSVPPLASGNTSQGSTLVTIPSVTKVGSYLLLACADDTQAIAEGNETNNCLASTAMVTVMLPDLTETMVGNPPAVAAPGTSFVLADNVSNNSPMASASSTTRFYLSLDATKNPGDVQLSGTRTVVGLPPGESSMGNTNVTVPASMALGTYRIVACADDPLKVKEAVDSNNCIASASTVVIAWPDLVAGGVLNPPSAAAPGASFTLGETITNTGAAPAAGSTTRYYLSTDSLRDGSDILLTGGRSLTALDPAGVSTGTKTVKVPATTPLAVYYVLACADDLLKVREASEANNCGASSSQIVIGRPDLRIAALGNPPATLVLGGKFTISDTVINQGTAPAASSSTRYFLSLDAVSDAGDLLLTGARSVPTVPVGGSSAGSKSVTVPTTVPAGTYFVIACADGLTKIAESDEANNCRPSATTVVLHP